VTNTFYAPSPPPQADSVAELRQWLVTDLGRIAEVINQGATSGLLADVINRLPDKPREGMLQFFAAGVAGTGAGFYEYSTGAWHKL
jgi:hypothetical protein